MDSDQAPMNKQNDHLGINKISRNIKKSPIHQPNFPIPNPNQPQPQPQVYNVNKNDFRNIVQQLTGSPLREPLPRPPQNHPKPPNNRLQRVRPPPLAPTPRPRVPIYAQVPVASQPRPLNNVPYTNSMVRPPHQSQFNQLSPNMPFPPTPNDVWSNTNESPVSAYMRYLQNSITDSGPQQGQPQNMPQPRVQPPHPVQNVPQSQVQPPHPGQNMPQNQVQPRSPIQNVPQPHYPVHNAQQPPQGQPRLAPNHGGPVMAGPPRVNGPHHMPPPSPRGANLATPRASGNIPPPLLSPSSQFPLPSPSGFLNLLSPRSPYPLLSPGYQNPPPRSRNFLFNSFGPGPNQPPPLSPGYGFPLSPSGFFPLSSPGWRG